MTLANERLKETGGVSALADEQAALALLKLIEEQEATCHLQHLEVY